MGAYIYAIIPYKYDKPAPVNECNTLDVDLPQYDSINEDFGFSLFPDHLEINTCYRWGVFTENEDGYSWLRAEIYKIAKAFGASEVWYVVEYSLGETWDEDFCLDEWKERIKGQKYTVELTQEVLKGNTVYSYYHDDFSDIILEKPKKKKQK